MTTKTFPLVGQYENGETFYDPEDTPIEVVQNWPEPEIRGHGVVRDKFGNIKEDINHGSNTI